MYFTFSILADEHTVDSRTIEGLGVPPLCSAENPQKTYSLPAYT